MKVATEEIAAILVVDDVIAQAVKDYMDDWFTVFDEAETVAIVAEAYREMMSV